MIQQSGSVTEYIEQFEVVSSQVPKLTEPQYIGLFMGGLRVEIRQRVHTLRPTTRWMVMQLARDVKMELGFPVTDGYSGGGLGHTIGPPLQFSLIPKSGGLRIWVALLRISRSRLLRPFRSHPLTLHSV